MVSTDCDHLGASSTSSVYRVYLGESFPLRVRPKAIALGSATSQYQFAF